MAETHLIASQRTLWARLRAAAAGLAESSRAMPAALVALVLGSAALRGFWAARVPTPWINGDETIYAELGRSLWRSGHLRILGAPTRFYTFVYPALAGGPLSLHDVELGYTLLKWLQALVMSLAAIPVYLWGRSLASRGWALAAAALTVAIPGLAYSGLLMTEVAFYPVLILAAWAMARALETPTLARQAIALAAIGVAAATRLQALVLAPVYLTAIALGLLLGRMRPRAALRFVPSLGGLLLLAAGWSVWQLSSRGAAGTDALGAYRAAGEIDYRTDAAAKFVAYHAADIVLLTGVVPACAVALLVLAAVRRREPSSAIRAYLAVTVATTGWFVVEVGVFASQLVGTLAERNLFALAPLFFLGLAVWLDRGGPRRSVEVVAVLAGAVGLVAALPLASLLVESSRWEAFTLLPLYDLRQWAPGLSPRVVVLGAVLPLVALAALTPRERLWQLPAALVAVFAGLSLLATWTVISSATSVRSVLLGEDKRWVDAAATRGPVAFVTGGEALWTAVYENVFWNRSIDRVYTLPGFGFPGPLPQSPVGPRPEGQIVFANGHAAPARFAIASNTLTFFGDKLAAPEKAKLALWRVQPPFRLSTWVTGVSIVETSTNHRGDLSVSGGMGSDARLVVYDCGGTFKLKLVARALPTTVHIRRNHAFVRRARIPSWRSLETTIPAVPEKQGACELEILTSSTLDVRLELTRS